MTNISSLKNSAVDFLQSAWEKVKNSNFGSLVGRKVCESASSVKNSTFIQTTLPQLFNKAINSLSNAKGLIETNPKTVAAISVGFAACTVIGTFAYKIFTQNAQIKELNAKLATFKEAAKNVNTCREAQKAARDEPS